MRPNRLIGVVLLSISPAMSSAADQIIVNPTPHLLNGGIEDANIAFENKTGVRVALPPKIKGCGATVLGLKSGKLDAGVMCCPPNKEEMGDLGLVASSVAREGLVVMVHESNPVSNLSTEQVRDIYHGRISNWKQVGGRDAPISAYAFVMCPNREDPSRQYLVGVRDYKKGVVGIDNDRFAQAVIRVKPGQEVPKSVAADPNGIGFEATVYLPVGGAKVINLDGIAPSSENIANGRYPAMRHLYIVTKGYPSGHTKQYVDFLRSPEGQALLQKEGKLVNAKL